MVEVGTRYRINDWQAYDAWSTDLYGGALFLPNAVLLTLGIVMGQDEEWAEVKVLTFSFSDADNIPTRFLIPLEGA